MIWGLKRKLSKVVIFDDCCKHFISLYRALQYKFNYFCECGVGIFFFFYINDFCCVIDIILKNIGETGWISEENIKFINYSAVLYYYDGHIDGYSEIKVFEEGKRSKKLKVYKELTPWPEGVISQYKIYYLKICKVVVGWEVVKGKKEKIHLNRKPKKSKQELII